MRGGETMADELDKLGNIEFHNHNVLDVVTNGNGQFLVVRANDNEPVTDTQYYMALARGRDGRDGRDGKDGKDGKDGVAGAMQSIDISDDGYWIIGGQKTNHKVPEPKSPDTSTTEISSGQDLNGLTANGRYFGDRINVRDSPFNDSSGVAFMLTVTAFDNRQVLQELVDLSTASKWIRSSDGSIWTSWRSVTQWN